MEIEEPNKDQRKKILLINILHNLVNIYTIYMISLLFKIHEDFYAYVIIVFTGLLIFFSSLRRNEKRQSSIYILLEILQIGFIYRLFEEPDNKPSIKYELNIMLSQTIVPQMTAHFIFLFCLGRVRNSTNILEETTYLIVLIDILLLLFLFIIWVFLLNRNFNLPNIKDTKLQITLSSCLKILPYYFSLYALSIIEFPEQIKLLFYQFIFTLLGFAFLYIAGVWKKTDKDNESAFYKQILFIILQVEEEKVINYPDKEIKCWCIKRENFIFKMQYFSQIIRVVLIIAFYNWNQINYFSYSFNNQVKDIWVFTTIILSIFYFLYFLKSLILVLQTKYIIIDYGSQISLQNVITYLSQKQQSISRIIIDYGYYYKKKEQLLQNDRDYCYEEFPIEFWQGISKQLKYNVKICFQNKEYIRVSQLRYLDDLENVHDDVIIQGLRTIESSCLMKRFEKGLLLNKTSHRIIFSGNDRNSYFSTIVAPALSITLFYKIQQEFIPVMPGFILYDLYDYD